MFAQIFRDFARDFDESKLLGVSLHPRLLYHCLHSLGISCRKPCRYWTYCAHLELIATASDNHSATNV